MSDVGGETVCWLDRVCAECGALTDSTAEACWRCGKHIEREDDDDG
ncbi:MAG TPA: hypothetical protein VNR37_06215 [Microbacteriaceae bacterium]|nr:hypothetical protein [Microbacteriaceae bacterium]